MLDRTVNVRLDIDLLHRIERKLAKVNAGRADRAKPLPQFSMSEILRKLLIVGLDVMDGDPDTFEDYFLEFFAGKLTATLALAANDPSARRLLKKIAADHKPDAFEADTASDFG